MKASRVRRARPRASGRDRLLDLIFDAVFTFRLEDGRISAWNRGAERAYGWAAAEALGQRPEELLASVLPAPRELILRELLQEGYWEGEISQRHRDGGRLVVDGRWSVERNAAGRAIGVIEVNRDVTEAWNARRYLQVLFEGIRRDAVILLDPEGVVRVWNPGAEHVFGWSGREMIGRRPPPALRLEPGDHEGWLPRKGGRVWGRSTATAVVDASGTVHGLAMVIVDLTAQRRDEERQAAHERSRAEFMNLAAHELRSPVTVIAGYLSMLTEGSLGSIDGDSRQILETLRAKVGQLSDMVEEIVEWTRLEEGDVELDLRRWDLNHLLTQAVDGFAAYAAPRHRITVALTPEPARVLVDRRRILLVIGSLLSVITRYSHRHSEIRCAVSATPSQLSVEVASGTAQLTSDEVDLLFARKAPLPRRLAASAGDAEPGLYLARSVARLHFGDVVIESQPGTTALRLWLPPAPGQPVPRA